MGWLTGKNENAGATGRFDGEDTYIEQNGDKTNIYTGSGDNIFGSSSPHGHLVVNDAEGVEYWRDSSGTVHQDSSTGEMK